MDPEDEMDPEAAQEVVAWDQDSAVNLADLVWVLGMEATNEERNSSQNRFDLHSSDIFCLKSILVNFAQKQLSFVLID